MIFAALAASNSSKSCTRQVGHDPSLVVAHHGVDRDQLTRRSGTYRLVRSPGLHSPGWPAAIKRTSRTSGDAQSQREHASSSPMYLNLLAKPVRRAY